MNIFSVGCRIIRKHVAGTVETLPVWLLLFASLFTLSSFSASAAIYHPLTTQREDILLDADWHFLRDDAKDAGHKDFNDSTWSAVSLPHTWNNVDGQSGIKDYYRGVGWYRKHYAVDKKFAGRRFFLKFDGAFCVTDVYINGTHLGTHEGGFAASTFDATPFLKVGGDNLIAVKVNSAENTNVPPLSADFTFFGGLYRDVHLLVTAPVQISPLDYGSSGVYLKTTDVSSNSAALQVTAVISNSTDKACSVIVRSIVTDAGKNIVTTLTNTVSIPGGTVSNVVANAVIATPHLWDGLADPYLYQASVELWSGDHVMDRVVQPLGFRYYHVDPDEGFFLNGRHYDLYGVSMHQDWLDCGWALNRAQLETNFSLVKEIGATAVRLSHYQHNEYTYQLADRNGVALWTEIPLVNRITESPEFYASAKRQLIELIRQNYNHPSVMCWGVFNEITMKAGPPPTKLARLLAEVVEEEDSTRPSVSAANAGDRESSNWCTEWNSFNKYFGWYDGKLGQFGAWADQAHLKYPDRCIGISEYGAGASIHQHSEEPVREPVHSGPYHPEEYQNLYHEVHWQEMNARPFLWCKFVWNLFDFAVAGRNEGDTPGRNDKGLITYDHQTRKDAFYYYQANWSTNPMVYITGHTFPKRLTNSITAKIYANCDSVELFLDDASQGKQAGTNCIFAWPLVLSEGTNRVRVIGVKGSVQVHDSLTWVGPVASPPEKNFPPTIPAVFHESTNKFPWSAVLPTTV